MPDQRQITVVKALASRVALAAAAEGVTVNEWVADAITAKLGGVPSAGDFPPVADRLPRAVVIVRLMPTDTGADRAGWKQDMTDEEWWEAARGYWHLGVRPRAEARYLAAADPDRIIRRLWRITDWTRSEDDPTRFYAVGGTPVTAETAADETEAQLVLEVIDHATPSQRNPVAVRYT